MFSIKIWKSNQTSSGFEEKKLSKSINWHSTYCATIQKVEEFNAPTDIHVAILNNTWK